MSTAAKVILPVVAVLLVGAAVVGSRVATAVDIGSAFLAKTVCSCVFVHERPVKDCRADQFSAMDRIRLRVQPDEGRVRAWMPLLGERTAVYRDGFGCTLE